MLLNLAVCYIRNSKMSGRKTVSGLPGSKLDLPFFHPHFFKLMKFLCVLLFLRRNTWVFFVFAHFVNNLVPVLLQADPSGGSHFLDQAWQMSQSPLWNSKGWILCCCEQQQLPTSVIFIISKSSAKNSHENLCSTVCFFFSPWGRWLWRGRFWRLCWVKLCWLSVQEKQLSFKLLMWNTLNMCPSCELNSERLWQQEINQGRKM